MRVITAISFFLSLTSSSFCARRPDELKKNPPQNKQKQKCWHKQKTDALAQLIITHKEPVANIKAGVKLVLCIEVHGIKKLQQMSGLHATKCTYLKIKIPDITNMNN